MPSVTSNRPPWLFSWACRHRLGLTVPGASPSTKRVVVEVPHREPPVVDAPRRPGGRSGRRLARAKSCRVVERQRCSNRLVGGTRRVGRVLRRQWLFHVYPQVQPPVGTSAATLSRTVTALKIIGARHRSAAERLGPASIGSRSAVVRIAGSKHTPERGRLGSRRSLHVRQRADVPRLEPHRARTHRHRCRGHPVAAGARHPVRPPPPRAPADRDGRGGLAHQLPPLGGERAGDAPGRAAATIAAPATTRRRASRRSRSSPS